MADRKLIWPGRNMEVDKTMRCGRPGYGECRRTDKLQLPKVLQKKIQTLQWIVKMKMDNSDSQNEEMQGLMFITWQKRNDSLFGVLLSSLDWEFVEDSHL